MTRKTLLSTLAILAGLLVSLMHQNARAQSAHDNVQHYGGSLGLRLGGAGEWEQDFAGATDRDDLKDESRLQISGWYTRTLDIGALENLGLGGRIAYLTRFEVDPDDSPDFELGPTLDLRGRADYPVPVTDNVTVHLVAEAGIYLLFPDGDFEDLLDGLDIDDGPRLGFAGALSGGASFAVTEGLEIRADLVLELHRAKIINDDVGGFDYEMTLGGNRGLLLVGVAL